jgi:GntR family transcriptional regulator
MARPPILRIDLGSRVPAYEQIAGEMRALLVGGELHPGDALPPVRQLAMDLGVHHNTVAQAYRELAEEGWLDLRRGRGARVLPRSGPPPSSKAKESFSKQLRRLVAEAASSGVPAKVITRELGQRARNVPARHLPKGSLA